MYRVRNTSRNTSIHQDQYIKIINLVLIGLVFSRAVQFCQNDFFEMKIGVEEANLRQLLQ
jgi:hypothetical protein